MRLVSNHPFFLLFVSSQQALHTTLPWPFYCSLPAVPRVPRTFLSQVWLSSWVFLWPVIPGMNTWCGLSPLFLMNCPHEGPWQALSGSQGSLSCWLTYPAKSQACRNQVLLGSPFLYLIHFFWSGIFSGS